MKLIFIFWLGTLVINVKACTWIFEGSCYNLMHEGLEFWASEAYCNSIYNGHLAAITTKAEDDFIRARLLDTHFHNGK